ncbi:hypothetical protein BASA81_016924 [Batrachochytrium salamandrivorans]|nr:hypothetical protein BASA81_016924 [Batrachochytrium salamandrivorans]
MMIHADPVGIKSYLRPRHSADKTFTPSQRQHYTSSDTVGLGDRAASKNSDRDSSTTPWGWIKDVGLESVDCVKEEVSVEHVNSSSSNNSSNNSNTAEQQQQSQVQEAIHSNGVAVGNGSVPSSAAAMTAPHLLVDYILLLSLLLVQPRWYLHFFRSTSYGSSESTPMTDSTMPPLWLTREWMLMPIHASSPEHCLAATLDLRASQDTANAQSPGLGTVRHSQPKRIGSIDSDMSETGSISESDSEDEMEAEVGSS